MSLLLSLLKLVPNIRILPTATVLELFALLLKLFFDRNALLIELATALHHTPLKLIRLLIKIFTFFTTTAIRLRLKLLALIAHLFALAIAVFTLASIPIVLAFAIKRLILLP